MRKCTIFLYPWRCSCEYKPGDKANSVGHIWRERGRNCDYYNKNKFVLICEKLFYNGQLIQLQPWVKIYSNSFIIMLWSCLFIYVYFIRFQTKCAQYWPKSVTKPLAVNNYIVTMKEERKHTVYVYRLLTVLNKTDTVISLSHEYDNAMTNVH